MAHAKIDDPYDDKRKMRRAWKAHPPNPIGLHIMAITRSARHRSGGYIEDDWLEEMVPGREEREAILATLVDAELFDVSPHREGTYRVHGFRKLLPDYRVRVSSRVRRAVLVRDGLVCQICGGDVARGDIDLDHRRPLSHGGANSIANLQVTHSSCNRRKGGRI